MRRSLVAVLLALAAPAAALDIERMTVAGLKTAEGAPLPMEVVSGRAWVRFSTTTPQAQRVATLKGAGSEINRDYPELGWAAVSVPAGQTVANALTTLRALPGVLDAQPNRAYRAVRFPSDPLVSNQYALSQVDAFGAWNFEVGDSSRVSVAIVDSGIDATHPDLAGKMGGINHQFCDPGANKAIGGDNTACATVASTPACNHATRAAGVAAAVTDNGTQVAGMMWGGKLLSIKVFRDADCTADCGGAACATDDQAIVDAINFARGVHNTAAYGKIVMNMSLGGAGNCAAAVQAAVTNAVNDGLIIVASAGNDGSAVNAPANCSGVIPVGATDSNNNLAAFSSRGAQLADGGLVAPGVALTTTDSGGGTASATGTSFSAPMVAGTAALIYSARPTLAGANATAEIKTALRGGADSLGLPASSQGAGRLNAFKALRIASRGSLAGFAGQQRPTSYPNPFRVGEHRLVSFAIPPDLQGANPKIKIFTQDGVLVREVNGLTWDGKNEGGNPVASGTYAFVVTTGAGTGKGRMAVIR